MIKSFALFVGVLLLVSMPFAESYSKTYVASGWLEVTRTLEDGRGSECPLAQNGISDVCANNGATQSGGRGAVFTLVTLSLKNIGSTDRSNVNIGESLSYVPTGAAISFSQSPSQFDGRQAVWEIAELKRGEAKNVTYEFGATVEEAAVGRIPDAVAIAEPSTVMLFAPSKVPLNGTLTLSLKSLEGRPIAGAKINVEYPDGSRQGVRTDDTGTVNLVATHLGGYTYSVEGYKLYQLASTVAYDKNAMEDKVPETSASAADSGILPGIVGALPIFAGIFAAAVIALIVYNFLSARREDEDASEPAPQLAEQQAKADSGMNYSQKFTFGTEDEHQKNMDDTTRRMVESRKRRMQESESAPPEEHRGMPAEEDKEKLIAESGEGSGKTYADAAPRGSTGFDESERTVANGDMDDELAELERNARIAGEVAEQEKEVENMLAQLESIRNKLRAGRQPGDAEVEQPEKPARKQPKPSAKAAAPSGKAATIAKKPSARQKPRKK